ncbi:glucans biosynthesis glucosyltransferase MdoH [Rhizobacter sp. J219]|uniref:glucans biosynthesis glucosyltransferase MdoH n=1 Tax=Rhizobacter sp. J219 TaxID=2898430 RepID=UPI00215157F8|nr:glucans biosynthesis glucosyltransferase MdoH [Rhizobacter sp. J219]MCR5885288.1 glucans biosynthesis glucosyltransferase MdoH [Rhizobacter sp. J219]
MDQHHSAGLSAAPGRSTPAIVRGSMVARPWRGFWASLADRVTGRPSDIPAAPAREPQAWERAAKLRRRVLMLLVLLSAAGATTLLSNMLPSDQTGLARGVQIGLYGLLFAWVSAGFYTAMMGAWVLWRGDPHAMSAASVGHAPIHRNARTAIVMPICNENVVSVFAGLRATCESLAATGASSLFDVYVLSDTSDPEIRAAELAAWGQLRHECGSAGRIYYRWRQRRTKRKSGNVADFCRRFGRLYRYMVVLDADSVMSGDCLVKLVRLMEANPTAGILQTAPQACGLDTVHARSQQFSGRVAGRLFTAGMSYWQLGESHYWGHNAIIRVEPFMKHCALAPLKGHGGLSGTLLSHDFVEAALMRRAGYHVWLVHDLYGSYEQQPPNLIEELQRDRRWCQGNLQNARLIAEPGLHAVHRAMLGTGAMAYLSAPLWLVSVLVGAGLWLFGERPLGGGALPLEIAGLWLVTVLMLMLPRVMGVAVIVLSKQQHRYGGTRSLIRGAALEAGLSALQAPVRMLAHTVFVVVALTGLKLDWKSPPREANDIGWRDAVQRFGPATGVVAAGASAVLLLQPEITLWLAPMALPLLLAVPLAVLTSRSGLGQRLLANRLLLIPEEHSAPQVLRRAWAYARRAHPTPQWRDALTDPWLFEVVRGAMGPRNTSWGSRGKARKLMFSSLLANQDAEQLSAEHRMRLLSEPQSIVRVRDQLAANANQMRASWLDGEEAEPLRA